MRVHFVIYGHTVSDVLKVSKIAEEQKSPRRVQFENFKTSQTTINLKTHEQVRTIFFHFIRNNEASADASIIIEFVRAHTHRVSD